MLAVVLTLGTAVVLFFGDMLMPVLAAVVIAYLLDGIVNVIAKEGVPRFISMLIVYISFMAFVAFVLFGLLPQLSAQATELFQQLPQMLAKGQQGLMQLPQTYPELISEEQVQKVIGMIRTEIASFGQEALAQSFNSVLNSLVNIIALTVYLILVPLLVFFFLKDKDQILGWISQYLPKERGLAQTVWDDVDRQIGNYVRGKFWEILIVWAATYAVFWYMELQYGMLLGVLVGLSVIIPYIGAAVVTVPVVLIAFFQWGWTNDFFYLMIAYLVVQGLDGNVLVPLLFSEVVNLHPVAIIVAILMFGGLWGFWGVFFAIPLATLVQAVLHAWPRLTHHEEVEPAS